ncbi:hypothetical protein IFU02_002630 (plasmid) [Pantoea agglomerans]|uniref:hypothetical protein n=1 Tax=Enterobacter agglomerans TaxID=549 RepID=UPI00178088F5|nr:hypothetical protein [Pantoea agglomerans]MBD8234735.1 hypothetical protein [Pantoea agglomerans]WVL83407.1 hypothetical protein IFU02_002785 [Pantoea agglomerans]WVL83431.1 hypothetical protein IFU02_002630 [Pantoea agglomerans]
MITWRWESATRWYEAELMCDLFGDWLVVRRWGGLYSERYGTKTDVVPDLLSGVALLFEIDQERQRRNPPYILRTKSL